MSSTAPNDIRFLDLADAGEARGLVVVIDVLRAFTTAAVALAAGAEHIVLVRTVDEALAHRDADPDVLLMGEVDGARPDGFDLSNSPSEVARADLAGRRVVHRTTAGTRGVVAASAADEVVAGAFVVASATVDLLRVRSAARVTFLVTGAHSGRDGDEDRAFGEFVAARLAGAAPDPRAYLARVPRSRHGRSFGRPERPELPAADLDVATDLDRFDFALVAERDGAQSAVLRATRP